MASIIPGLVEELQINNSGTKYRLASSAYGECNSAANEAAKVVEITGFNLITGVTIHVKFINSNTVSNPTLQVRYGSDNADITAAKPIMLYGSIHAGTVFDTSGWQENAIISLTYDGTSWVRDQGYNTDTDTWNALSTSQAGYVAQAPNDTTKFLRGDATWAVLPAASSSVAGITKVGASGGAAAYSHDHDSTYLRLNGSNTLGTANTSSAASTPGVINFYNTAAAADPQTTTILQPSATSNVTISLPVRTGTLALKSEIEDLDAIITGTPGAGKTVTAFSQTDGKVAITFADISITKSQVSDFAHAHGNLTNAGKITATTTIANGDRIAIIDKGDDSDYSLTGSSIEFDGSTDSQALTKKGTWVTFSKTDENVKQGVSSSDSWRKIILSGGDVYNAWNTTATTRTNQVYQSTSIAVQPSTGALRTAGALTVGGLITTQANQDTDAYSGALNMGNSNIYGVNSIYTADSADNAAEGIHFYRDSTHVDTLWMNDGDLLFVPNRALGTSTTKANSQKVGRFTTNPTSGDYVTANGTTGGLTTISAATLREQLGLSNALHFICTTTFVNGQIDLPSGYTPATGDVVLVDGFEYIYVETNATEHTGTWEKLGDDSSFKLKQTAITDADTQSPLTFVSRITQNAHGVISVTKTNVPTASRTDAGVVSTDTQAFAGKKTFWDTIEVYTSYAANATDKIAINGTSIEAITGTANNGTLYLQSNGGYVTLGNTTAVNFTMNGNSYFNGNMGIGVEPETATSGTDLHKLKVNGSIVLLSGATSSPASVAHLDVATVSNNKVIQIYPHTNDRGSLGLTAKRWTDLYLTTSISIGADAAEGFYGTASGTLTLAGSNPTITLDASSGTDWTINNNQGTFGLDNGTSSILGSSAGFKLVTRLYINTDIPTTTTERRAFYVTGVSIFNGVVNISDVTESTTYATGALLVDGGVGIAKNLNVAGKVGIGTDVDTATTDPHELVILGSTLIKAQQDTTVRNAAHLDVSVQGENAAAKGQLLFYPHETDIGSIGTSSNQWNSGYFSDIVSITGTTSSVVIKSSASSSDASGSINITGTTPIITLTGTVVSPVHWTIKNDDKVFKINSLSHTNTYITGTTNSGFRINPRLAVGAAVNSNYALYVSGATLLSGATTIGTTSTASILTLMNALKLQNGSTVLAHFKYENITGNASTVFFYPEAAENGSIGLADHRWKDLYISNDFNIANSAGHIIDINTNTGTLTIETNASSEVLVYPTIALNITDTNKPNWTIKNNDGTFTINNGSITEFSAISGRGFKITPRLYINTDLDSDGAYNFYVKGVNNALGNIGLYGYVGIGTDDDSKRNPNATQKAYLTVQDFIKIAHDSGATITDVGQLKYYTTGSGADLVEHFLVSTKDRIGELGDASHRWDSIYLYSGLDMRDAYNNNGTDYITISTVNGYGSQYHMSSNTDKAMIDMITGTNAHVTLNLTSTVSSYDAKVTLSSKKPIITLNTSTANKSDWSITNDEGTLKITDNTVHLYASADGFEFNTRIHLNNTLDNTTDYIFLINNRAAATMDNSMFQGYLGVGTDTDILRINGGSAYLTVQSYFKLVNDSGTTRNDLTHLKYNSGTTQVQFYPENNNTDVIGLTTNRWKSAYLSDTIDLQQTVSGVVHSITMTANGAAVSLSAPTPYISLVTTAAGVTAWTIQNDGTAATPTLNIQETNGTAFIQGYSGKGWKIGPRIYIGEDIPTTNPYALYINGDAHITGGINSNNNVFPTTNMTQSLGLADAMWGSCYLYSISARFIDAAPNAINSDKTLYIGYNQLQPTSAVKVYYSTGSSRTEELRVNDNGVYALVRLMVATTTVNTAYKLSVGGASNLAGNVNLGGHITPSTTNSYDIGSHNPAAEGASYLMHNIFTDTLSVRYIDAAPARHDANSTIYIGYYNKTVNNDHAITPTAAIKFYTSVESTTQAPLEQMVINADGIAIRNTLQFGHLITSGGTSSAENKIIKYQGTNTNSTMIQFLNNVGDATGNGILVGSGGVTILGSGSILEALIDTTTPLVNINSPNVYIAADGLVSISANGSTPANRVGLQITTAGNIVPSIGDARNNNEQTLGVGGDAQSCNRWKAVYIGTNDTYGSNTQPIYWNNGVPAPCSSDIGNNERPIYSAGGVLTACSYYLHATIDGGTANTLAYYTTATEVDDAAITSDGTYLGNVTYLTVGAAHQTNYAFSVTGGSYFTGDLTFATVGASATGSSLNWSGPGAGASIFYKSTATSGSAYLTINTKDNANCLVALAHGGTNKAYFANNTPSFYPATTNTGSLGLGNTAASGDNGKRWSKVYVGTADSYGGYGKPVYWNAGVPEATFPVQYTTWTIANGTNSVTITKANKYYTDTYVISLVVTQGESNLPAPLKWDTNTAGSLIIKTSDNTNVSGEVKGYVITARGDNLS